MNGWLTIGKPCNLFKALQLVQSRTCLATPAPHCAPRDIKYEALISVKPAKDKDKKVVHLSIPIGHRPRHSRDERHSCVENRAYAAAKPFAFACDVPAA